MRSARAPIGSQTPCRAGLHAAIVLFALAFSAACSDDPAVESDTTATGDAGVAADGADGLAGKAEPFTFVKVTPARGALVGGEAIDIEGSGFTPDARVFFGGVEAVVSYRAGSTHVFAVAPPAAVAGQVTVRVQNAAKGGAALDIVKAYTYIGAVTVDGFEPALGPDTGGTSVTVHGSGFLPGDKVLVGFAEAISTQFLDPGTLVAQVPAYGALSASGTAKVIVSVRHAGGVTHAKGSFTYGRVPRADRVDPGTVGLDGGAVTLHGVALGNTAALYAKGALSVLAAGTATSVRGATLPGLYALDPQAKPGPADVVLTSPFGASKLSPAFVYASGTATGAPLVYAVVPAAGPTVGGTVVSVLADLHGGSVSSVKFGGKIAVFQQKGIALEATVPPGVVGTVPVEVVTGAGSSVLQKGFTYLAPLELQKLIPESGPLQGGSTVDVKGKGFSAGCTVRIGVHLAKVVSAAADGKTLTVTTPPGAGGSADVTVTCSTAVVTLANGFAYTDGKPHIHAVIPASGATGGNTTVRIYGTGFKKGMSVTFGGKPAAGLVVLNSGLAEGRTPPRSAGPVAVDVVFGKDVETLLDGFTYYNPINPHGGTWGLGVGGTLNVTVLDIYSLSPIPGATVILGEEGQSNQKAVTDATGQVVFSGPDVVAPVTVSASKAAFSASSIVSFDAENATLLLFPLTPPSSGGGGGGAALPFATLKGKVLDLDKYLQVPPTNCLKSGDLGDKTCDTCKSDADCAGVAAGGATFQCVNQGVAGSRCLADCTQKDVCHKGFACFADSSAPGSKFCKPSMGIRKVFCATSLRDIDSTNPPPGKQAPTGPGALPYPSVAVDETTGGFEISSRLDELAIQCVGGFVDTETKKFVPTLLGIRRHVFPKPGETMTGLDVKLDIPLRRTLSLRLDHPQAFYPGNQGGTLRIGAWLELGSDGYVRLHDHLAVGTQNGITGVANDVALPYQPLGLPKDLTETSYTYYARAEFGTNAESPPLTATLHPDVVAPGDTNLRIRKQDGTTEDLAIGLDQPLSGVVAGPDGQVLIAGRSGRVYYGPEDDPSLLWAPPVLDPYAVPAVVLAVGGTPTDATIVGENGLIRRVFGTSVTQEQGALAVHLNGVCHGPLGRVAVGDGGALQVFRTPTGAAAGVWQQVKTGIGQALRGVVCTPLGAVAVGDQGQVVDVSLAGEEVQVSVQKVAAGGLYAVAIDGAGQIWAAGQATTGSVGGGPPAALIKRVGLGGWQPGWPSGFNPGVVPGLRAVVALANAGVLVVDREGGLHRVDAAGVNSETGERKDLRPVAGATLPDGRAVLVGQPGLWLGPFLTIPTIDKPTAEKNPSALPLEWSFAPGPSPSFTRVHLDGSGFPFWWVYVEAAVSAVLLPDFKASNIQVFPNFQGAQYTVRIDRVYMPAFSINGFSTFDLEFGAWRSWATNARGFLP